jgi:hypothetical protein
LEIQKSDAELENLRIENKSLEENSTVFKKLE